VVVSYGLLMMMVLLVSSLRKPKLSLQNIAQAHN